MPYVLLGIAIICECIGTYFMKLAEGFTHLLPTLLCLVFYGVCFWVFSKALENIPLSVAYASWSALGIILATAISVFMFHESANAMVIAGVAICVIGVILVNVGSVQ